MRVYVGTSTGPKSKGIYLYDFDLTSGVLKQIGVAAETRDPTFVALSPDGSRIYAVGVAEGQQGTSRKKADGAVNAFSVDPATGMLALLNSQSSGGSAPCHISLDSSGKHAFVANYSSGNVASFPIEADGKLGPAASVMQHEGSGPDKGRQEGPHAHGIWPSPDDKFVLTCDLGLDKVLVYKLDPATGKLMANDPPSGSVPPGAGVRHAAFSHDGKFFYAINEMGNSMTTFAWNAGSGALAPVETVTTLPAEFKEKSYCSEVVVHPSGKYVYGANRGHDSVAVFSADTSTGKLTLIETTPVGGKFPRHINLDPSGKWLIAANEHSADLVVFRVDPDSGKLTQVGPALSAPTPMCVVFAAKPK
jgi:6-phosphogluconolactonase